MIAEIPASSAPQDSRLGVHTRLTDEPESAKIATTLKMVRQMGAASIVEYFPWAYFEPQPGRFDWTHADLVMREAGRQGLRVYARIDLVPQWARPAESPSQLLTPEHLPVYAQAVARFAERYAGKLAGIIVWNEPNLELEWGFRPVSPVAYVDLLRLTYQAVHERSPQVRVVAAGLAPTLERSPRNLEDLAFLAAMYHAGAAQWFDALAVHAYGWLSPPEQSPIETALNFRRVELLRQVMEANGDGAKSMVLTEGGWNGHPRWTKSVGPSARISFTIRALELSERNWPWMESVNFWVFRLPRPAHNYNDGYTFVSPEFTALPIYDSVAEWVRSRASGVAAARGRRAELGAQHAVLPFSQH